MEFRSRRPGNSPRQPFRRCLGTSERAFSSSWAFGPSTWQRRACLGAEAPRFASHRLAGPSGIAFSAAPKCSGAGSPFRVVLQPRSASPWSATPKMHWNTTSPAGVTVWGHVAVCAETLSTRCSHQIAPSGRSRPALPFTAAQKRVGSRLRRSAAPSKQPFRRAEAQRTGVIGSEPSSTLRLGRFPPHRFRALDRVINGRPIIGETLQTRLSSRLRLGGSLMRRNAPDPDFAVGEAIRSTSSTAPERRGRGFPSGRAFKPPPVSDGHRCANARRIPTRRATFGSTAQALTGVPASAPKHLGGDGRSSKGHGASCRLAVPFSSAQRRVGFRLRRLRAQPGPLLQTPKRWMKRTVRRCRSEGAWGPPVSAAPERLGSQSRRGHRPRGCARRNRSRCRKKSSITFDSSARSARWAQALRGSATPRIARDFLGPRPDWSLIPDSSQGMRRVR